MTSTLQLGHFVIAVLLASISLSDSSAQRAEPPSKDAASRFLDRLLGAGTESFRKAESAWEFRFPEDHAAHPEFRTESWIFQGHLEDERGGEFSFQLGFFRLALAANPTASPSAWTTNQVYRGYFSFIDLGTPRFLAFERFARGALGLSGTAQDPVRVWVEDWKTEIRGGEDAFYVHLRAAQDGVAVDLELETAKPPLLQPAPANSTTSGASAPFHFYLAPRLQAAGTVTAQGRRRPVRGEVWFDRAWGELPIPGGPVSTNRFVLLLDDGSELNCLQIHGRLSRSAPRSSCVLIGDAGEARPIEGQGLRLDALGSWTSSVDGTRYPAGWRLVAAQPQLDLRLDPVIDDQEALLSLRTWAGAVRAEGLSDGVSVRGRGFVELSGYDRES